MIEFFERFYILARERCWIYAALPRIVPQKLPLRILGFCVIMTQSENILFAKQPRAITFNYSRYERFVVIASLKADPNTRWCPGPGCVNGVKVNHSIQFVL